MTNEHVEVEHDGTSVIKTELPVTFSSLGGEKLAAKVTHIVFREGNNGSEPSCVITMELSNEAGLQAMRQEWFHSYRNLRKHDPEFKTDTPFEIRALLRADLAARMAAQGMDAEHVVAFLLPAANSFEGSLPLKQAECWYAQRVTQVAELPEELQGTGSLKIGFQTVWANSSSGTLTASDSTESKSVRAFVESFLQMKDLTYESVNGRLLRLRFSGDNVEWVCLIRIEEDADLCALYSVFPNLVPEEKRAAVAVALMGENYDLLSGGFELDPEDGELRYRTTVYAVSKLDDAAFHNLFADHLEIVQRYLPEVNNL